MRFRLEGALRFGIAQQIAENVDSVFVGFLLNLEFFEMTS